MADLVHVCRYVLFPDTPGHGGPIGRSQAWFGCKDDMTIVTNAEHYYLFVFTIRCDYLLNLRASRSPDSSAYISFFMVVPVGSFLVLDAMLFSSDRTKTIRTTTKLEDVSHKIRSDQSASGDYISPSIGTSEPPASTRRYWQVQELLVSRSRREHRKLGKCCIVVP